jgi:hypothetical protein
MESKEDLPQEHLTPLPQQGQPQEHLTPLPQQGQPQQQPQRQQAIGDPKLVNIEVKDQNVALNLMVHFLNLAQRRGAYGLDESAKIWECIQQFQNGP